MIPSKIAKNAEKPSSKASNQSYKLDKSITDKSSQQSSSVRSKVTNNSRDSQALIKKASKKQDEIQKKLRQEAIRQRNPKSKDTKSDRSLIGKSESKISHKKQLKPHNNKSIISFLGNKSQIQNTKSLKSHLENNAIRTNKININKKLNEQPSDLDASRTLSNDQITSNLPKKLSKKGNDKISMNSSLVSQKNSQKLKVESGLLKSSASEVESKKSKVNHQNPIINSSKQRNQSKEKSSHVVDPYILRIPSYSNEELKQIQLRLNLMDKDDKDEALKYSLCLISWIWEAYMPFSKNLPNSHKIDSAKCLRKLLEIHRSASRIFYQSFFLNKIRFQSEMYLPQSSFTTQQKSEHTESSSDQKSPVQKTFIIYDIIDDLKNDPSKEVNISLMSLLFEIIIFNYDDISNLDEATPASIFHSFRNHQIKNKNYEHFKEIDLKIFQELIIFVFSQLHYLKTNVNRSSQFLKKKKMEGVLWKFFMDFIKIFHHQIKAKQFINFRIGEAITLETGHFFLTEFTHYAKCFPLKSMDHFVNMIEFEAFAQTFVERVIEFSVYVFHLKDKQKKSNVVEIDGPDKIVGFSFDLPIYDWAILAIKSDERRTFQNLVRHCKKLFIKNLQKKSTSKYETFKNKPYVADKYARFTIQEMPEEDTSFYDNSNAHYKAQKQEDQSQYKLSYEKLKGFVSIPHMNLLVFKQLVPMSVKRLSPESKSNHSKENLQVHLLYLLVLSNSEYLLKLILEIEFSCTQMFNPEIGKGLVRLCSHCHDFKSVIIGEKYLKLLRLNSFHKQILQKVFQKDYDFQRRLSSMMNNNVAQKPNNLIGKQKQKINSQQNVQSPQLLQAQVNSCQSMYFQMIMEIENVVPFIKLDHYLHQLLKKPNIFRTQKFYAKLLQIQHPSSARLYFQELINNYLDQQLRVVDLKSYFEMFAQYCLKKDIFEEMLILVQSLPIGNLVKFHSLLFAETFTDQIAYRVMIPDGLARQERLSILTSAGYQERTKFIDQHCPNINEVILWRKYLKPILPFEKVDMYICIKSFFTIVHQVFSDPQNSSKNQEYLRILIEKFKIWIDRDKICQIASAFHFLSLGFFPHQQSKTNSHLSKKFLKERQSLFSLKIVPKETGVYQKITLELLYIIGEHTNSLIEMYKIKQALTLKHLGQEMRNRANDDKDQTMDDIKRRQVSKMLNKLKNIHDYMIRCIVRFVENVNYTTGVLSNFPGPEEYLENIKKICRCEHIQKEQKRIQAIDEYYTPKLSLKLSSVSSNNQFQFILQKYIKRQEQSPKYFHEKYDFLTMLRCVAETWIDQKLPSSKDRTGVPNESKNKSQLIVDEKQSKSKDKEGYFGLSAMIPIDQIFEICIKCINTPISSHSSLRQCEVLKQKLVSFETLILLLTSFTKNFEILKIMAPAVALVFKKKRHSQICQIVLELLANNKKILGKDEKDLINAIRLKALSLLIQNFNHQKREWNILNSPLNFWFLINTLLFDKNIEIRFLIIKSLYSRDEKLSKFKQSMIEKMVASILIASQQNIKPFAKIAKKSLTVALDNFFVNQQINGTNLLNLMAMQYFLYLVNFNTVHYLQKGELKLDYREFFMAMVDVVFDKKDSEAYLYAIFNYFTQISNSSAGIRVSEMFVQLKWHIDINVDFYIMTRPSKTRSLPELDSQNSEDHKAYLELLEDMKNQLIQKEKDDSKKRFSAEQTTQIYDKMYPKCNQMFKANLNEALTVIIDVFSQRAAKGNKKALKTKKPQSVFRNFGTVFNPQIKDMKAQFKNKKFKAQKKKPNENDIEI